MRILMIGGTRFVGKHIVEAATASGHDVTIFHRGKTGPDKRESLKKREATRESSRREQAKDGRRTSIVSAARKLIQATGETGFQMRALAGRNSMSNLRFMKGQLRSPIARTQVRALR